MVEKRAEKEKAKTTTKDIKAGENREGYEGRLENVLRIPDPIINFFMSDGGRSLIIKGKAGTGKTTMALEIIGHFVSRFPAKYIPSRVADVSLLEHFPWIRDVVEEGKFELCVSSRESEKEGFIREHLDKLEGRIEEGLIDEEDADLSDHIPVEEEDGEFVIDMGEDLPELEDVYNFVEGVYPEKSLVVFDSLEGLADIYGVPAKRLMYTVQKDLVERDNANVIFVMEKDDDNELDYLVDGIVRLERTMVEGRILRTLYIEKLRGVAVRHPVTFFSLVMGHFFAPPVPHNVDLAQKRDLLLLLPDQPDCLSTGFPNLDRVIGGGIPEGQIAVFSSGRPMSPFIYWGELAVVVSALKKKKGVLWVPSQNAPAELAEKCLPEDVKKKVDGDMLRIAEVPISSPTRFTLPVEGHELFKELAPFQVSYYFRRGKKPYVYVMDIQSLFSIYGGRGYDTFRYELLRLISLLRAGGHTVLLMGPEKDSIGESIMSSVAPHIHVAFRREKNVHLVMGEIPFTSKFLVVETDSGFEAMPIE